MLARSGYGKEAAGGLLAAGGLGAIISPPVLGAAAFLIAEFLKISYLDVILMATIPTVLYYLSLFLMVELDVRKFGMREISTERFATAGGAHAQVLVPLRLAAVDRRCSSCSASRRCCRCSGRRSSRSRVSFLDRASAMVPARLVTALKDGSLQMLNVAATCAAAGIIVGVVAKTGLGLKFSAIVIDYAGGSLVLTALYTALIVWIVGLAVPVTASYIICAVIAAPALIKLGVPDYAAHMFIFYYAVLSEVSPPTALSPFAAAAITGGDPYKTTLQAWKYTLPAFVVPFVFVLDPAGVALLLKSPPQGSWLGVAWIAFTACVGIGALATGTQGWLLRRCGLIERTILIVAGLALVYPAPAADLVGFAGVVAVLAWQWLRRPVAPDERPVHRACASRRLFARYGESHRHPANKAIHWVCVPLITWSRAGRCCGRGRRSRPMRLIALALAFYAWLSPADRDRHARRIAALMIAPLTLFGPRTCCRAAIVVFALAWIGQFIGHRIEGKKPSFLEDIEFLLVGPAWLLGALYRRSGVRY